jgi:uncharacterized protein YodC (DUF2158 family)
LALTLGFERVCCTLFGSAKRLDSGLVGCGWFDDFGYSHQVFSLAQWTIFTTSSAGFVVGHINSSNLSQPAKQTFFKVSVLQFPSASC